MDGQRQVVYTKCAQFFIIGNVGLMYLILWGLICIGLFVFLAMGLNIRMQNSGHHVDGLRFKEYQLQDYRSWIIKQTREEYQLAQLDPTEAGCCRPPSECGYPAIDASFYNLSLPPTSSHKDCKLYKNSNGVKCFNCDSCNCRCYASDVA